MNRREFVQRLAAMMPATPAPSVAAPAGAPNLVYIFADQMRFCEMGCSGNQQIRTPNLDRLAAQGVRMTNAFSASPLCSPYRAQLQTGTYGHVNGVPMNGRAVRQDLPGIATVLKRSGYATGYIGKWHIAGVRFVEAGPKGETGFVPPGGLRMGWDYWAVHECWHRYFNSYYFRDTPEPVFFKGFESDAQTDLAIEYMKQNRARPFALMLSWGPPHDPLTPPERWRVYDPSRMPIRPNVPSGRRDEVRKETAAYYALISTLDENMGRIMTSLDELGIAENTILCFSSDHGNMMRSHNMRLKQKPWEESAHIPFLIRYPRRLKPGRQNDLLFNSVDVMPTLLGLMAAAVPETVQGTDWSRSLTGSSGPQAESIYLALDSVASAEQGRAAGAGGRWRAVRTTEWLYAMQEGRDWLLYDMKSDPFQMKNLAGERSSASRTSQMKRLLRDWMNRTGDRPWPVG